MERTKHDFNQWMSEWPPVQTKKVLEGEGATEYLGIGMGMMLYLKTQARLGQIQTNKISKILADGTQIIVQTSFGNDRITVIRPEQQKEEIFELPGEYVNLFLAFTVGDFRLFLINLVSSTSLEIPDPVKFWKDENFYQGPWEADMFSGGFGSGTASSLNDFLKSWDPLILNTVNHTKWHIVTDNNWNLSGLTYFPTLVLMNVPGVSPHAGLNSGNCFDYPLCFSAIIPANACAFCFAYWPFHGVLPLNYESYYIMPEVWVPLLKDANQEDDQGNPLEYVEWTKKSQVWRRGAVTGTPVVDITGKANYSLTETEKSKLDHALNYRESIYPIGSRGTNTRTGNWWNTWNEVLHIYQPCWVDITRGFGGDESGWWPFWNWLHETAGTGIAAYAAYANLIYGGNTRQAQGWGMHWLKYDPENPDADPVEESLVLTDLDETLTINDGPCTHTQTTNNQDTGGCSYLWGTIDTAYADGNYSGKFFFPVATLGNKRFIFFENTFSGSGIQTAYRHTGGFYACNLGLPECQYIGPCCTSIGWYCFGLCDDCAGHESLICSQGNSMSLSGSQNHSFSLTQVLKIGKVQPGGAGTIESIVIATGQQSYSHQFSGSYYTQSGISTSAAWPSPTCDDPFVPHCGCNSGPINSPEDSASCSDRETYSRDITAFEVMDYCSNPKNDDLAVLYKKIVIQHACSTSGCSETNWSHSGTRVVTWHLYVNVNGEAQTFDLTPTFTASRSGGQSGASAVHSGAGNRVYGASLQINDDYLGFSYLEEAWGGLGANFNNIIGQNMYPGPMNLEDRNVEPFYDMNGNLVWDNIGAIWNPAKYHYGIIALHSRYDQFKKWEWEVDMTKDEEGNEITDGSNKKVYTVGLLFNDGGNFNNGCPVERAGA